ncbi:CHC2 zinc finger domain-containing protein [Catellatospora sichuanensis]|uniref:CHC2 zinc finger domain-containing protein n=1 Tax=Catellatospora sichuanensis TaxID=1969805 RepID=UPI001C8FE08E
MEKPPIDRVLEHYGAQFVPTGARWRRMKCPFQESGDRNPSASVNTELGRFKCFSCDVNEDAFGLVIWKGDARDFVGAKQFLEDLLGGSYGSVQQQSSRQSRRGVFEESGPVRGQRSIATSRVRRKPLSGS